MRISLLKVLLVSLTSVFVYLYRTLKLGVPKEVALEDVHAIFDPTKQDIWAKFIADAEAKYR